MYKDIISYKLAENISEEHLLAVAGTIIKSWMNRQPGFIKWEIHKEESGRYTDIVYWESKDAAKNAEAQMGTIPNAGDWYACYENSSIASRGLYRIAEFE